MRNKLLHLFAKPKPVRKIETKGVFSSYIPADYLKSFPHNDLNKVHSKHVVYEAK